MPDFLYHDEGYFTDLVCCGPIVIEAKVDSRLKEYICGDLRVSAVPGIPGVCLKGEPRIAADKRR